MGGNARCSGGTGGKVGPKLKKLIFQRNQENCSSFVLILHNIDPNYSSFYLKCPRKYQKTYNFNIFLHFPKFTPLPLQNFVENTEFDYTPLCIYY